MKYDPKTTIILVDNSEQTRKASEAGFLTYTFLSNGGYYEAQGFKTISFAEWEASMNEKWVECLITTCIVAEGKLYKVVKEDTYHWVIEVNGHELDYAKNYFKLCDSPKDSQQGEIVGYRHESGRWVYKKDGKFFLDAGGPFDVPIALLQDKELGWTPQYAPAAPKHEILTIGDKKIAVKISKGKIEADGKEWSVKKLEGWFNEWVWHDLKCRANSWTVGCTTITREELNKILEIYKKFND